MAKQIQLDLEIGAIFSAAITLDTTQAGRTHRAHIRETASAITVKLAFSTASGIALAGDTVTLSAGADVTELLNLATDSALWVIDIESVGATAADVRREARGTVLISRDITRTTEATPSPSALGFVAYSEAQTLTAPQQLIARTNIGAGAGGGSSDAVLYTAQTLTAPQQLIATTNISAATVAALASHTQAASTISDSTAAGRALLTAASVAAQRTALALGSLATQSGTFSGTSSGTNTGDQTSIAGLTGTKAQFDTAVTDGNFAYAGDAPTAHTQALSTIAQSGATIGQIAQWDGTAWVPVTPSAGGSPGGSSGQIQYNNAGAFGGDAGLTFNATTKAIGVSGQFLPSIGYSPSAPAYSSAGSPTSGMTFSGGNAFFSSGGASISSIGNTGLTLRSLATLGFTSGSADAAGSDAAFSRLSANKIGLGNGTLSDVSGTLVVAKIEAATLQLGVFTVATLPAAPTVNDVCSVNNALAPTWRGIVAAGGAELVDVKWTGTNWICQ